MTVTQQPAAGGYSAPNWLGVLLSLNLVGCVLVAATAGLSWRSLSLSANGQVAAGRVVGLVEDEPSELFTRISPVVEFEASGVAYSVRSHNAYPWWDRYLRFPVGRAVEVRYDPANPVNAEINSWLDLWTTPVCLGGFTVLFVLAVNGFMLMRWRQRRTLPAPASS